MDISVKLCDLWDDWYIVPSALDVADAVEFCRNWNITCVGGRDATIVLLMLAGF